MRSIIQNKTVARAAGTVGILGHLVAAIVYIVLPSLEVPYRALFVFEAAWVIVLIVSVWWLRANPWRSAVVPLVGVCLAGAARVLGEQYLGWRG